MSDEETLRERRRAHRLARRLIRFLRDGWEWEIRFMPLRTDARARRSIGFERIIVGACLWDRHLICIDPRYRDFFAVLIHECLHGLFPEMSEQEVRRLEDIVRRHLTVHQAKHLLVWTVNRLH